MKNYNVNLRLAYTDIFFFTAGHPLPDLWFDSHFLSVWTKLEYHPAKKDKEPAVFGY